MSPRPFIGPLPWRHLAWWLALLEAILIGAGWYQSSSVWLLAAAVIGLAGTLLVILAWGIQQPNADSSKPPPSAPVRSPSGKLTFKFVLGLFFTAAVCFFALALLREPHRPNADVALPDVTCSAVKEMGLVVRPSPGGCTYTGPVDINVSTVSLGTIEVPLSSILAYRRM